MNRPKKDEPRSVLYLVTTANYAAGKYVGETEDRVVLDIGQRVQGFLWREVQPVELRESGA